MAANFQRAFLHAETDRCRTTTNKARPPTDSARRCRDPRRAPHRAGSRHTIPRARIVTTCKNVRCIPLVCLTILRGLTFYIITILVYNDLIINSYILMNGQLTAGWIGFPNEFSISRGDSGGPELSRTVNRVVGQSVRRLSTSSVGD